jgi:uncharacterized protein
MLQEPVTAASTCFGYPGDSDADQAIVKAYKVHRNQAVQFRSQTELTAYRTASPRCVIPVSPDRKIILHPPSGAWAMVTDTGLPIVVEILRSAESGTLNTCKYARSGNLLKRLYDCGLLRVTGVPVARRRNLLQVVVLKLTAACNMACRYCYDDDRETRGRKLDLNTGRIAIQQALDCADANLEIIFHGGEPLLAFRELRELTAFAKERAADQDKHVAFMIQTNGTRFTPEIVRFLLNERFYIGISLDGPAEMNDAVRIDHKGRSRQREIEDAIRRYPSLLGRGGLLATVTSRNARRIEEVAHYFRGLGATRMSTSMFLPNGRAAFTSDLPPDPEDLIAGHLDLLNSINRGRFPDMAIAPLMICAMNVLSNRRADGCRRNRGCCAAREFVSITVNGDIESCDCVRDHSLRLGSVHDSTIADCLRGPVAERITSRTESSISPCSSCSYRAFCGGTCFARAGGLDGFYEIECRLMSAIFPAIFRMLAESDGLERYCAQVTRRRNRAAQEC